MRFSFGACSVPASFLFGLMQECHMSCRVYHRHLVTGALLPVMHTLFEVVKQMHGVNEKKSLPRALRCKLTSPLPAGQTGCARAPLPASTASLCCAALHP